MKFAHQPIIVLTILSTLLFANSIRAQIFTGPGFTVVDGGGRVSTSCSTINVSGITGSRIVRAVTLDSTNHSWIGDTEARLYPPGAAPR